MVPAAFRNICNVCIALAFCASFAAAASTFPDQTRIRSDYHNGDFDKVIKALEAFQKSGRACTAAESLFLEKHLAVVYAANPVTRELGRYHMFKMLDLAPGSDLLDMFVGEEVDGVFDKVRKEYSLHAAAKKSAPAPKVAAAPVRAAPAPVKAVPVKSSWDTAPVSARAAWEPAPAQANGGWQNASLSYAPKASRANAPAVGAAKSSWESAAVLPVKAAPKAAPARSWDDFSAPSARTASASGSAEDIGSSRSGSGSSASSAFSSSPAASSTGSAGSSDVPTEFHSSGSPAWKEPGLWIGGGAALAVVALTFFYSNSSDAPPAKTYVVPASAAR